jgi:flagellar basal-body rod protein FlgC
MMKALDISASALEAQRVRMEVVAQNLANAQTTRATRAPDGSFLPYRRRETVFQALLGEGRDGPRGGVRVDRIQEDKSDFRLEYNPHHPDADAQGNVRMPNVDVLMEMVDLIEASRAYEANITAMDATKAMAASSLRILA